MNDIETRVQQKLDIARRNLKIACALRDTNPNAVSEAVDISRNVLGTFIAGRATIKYDNLLKCCDHLGVPVSLLDHPDGITPSRLKLYQALQRLPDHLAEQALEIVSEEMERDHQS